MSRKEIPGPIIALLSDYLGAAETHASLDNLFLYAEAPGDPPEGSKIVKAQAWLRRVNKESDSPMKVLGKLIENYMESDFQEEYPWYSGADQAAAAKEFKEKLKSILARYGLQYHIGGYLTEGGSVPSKSLYEMIQARDIPGLEAEFNRALSNIAASPREAVSAACNILETLFKVYIHDEGLQKPQKLDIQSVWKVVREDLGLDTKRVEDDDLRKIISGIFSIVDGIGALRSHASSAHGQGRNSYNLKPRHARLAVNSAHTLALFILESWDERNR